MLRASDLAYDAIREQILSGELPPTTQLKESELAVRCGVSRTPVRDALRRLESEMLVRRSDTQRTYVQSWSADEVDEIFTLRGLMESHSAALAAQHITPPEIDALRRHNDRILAAIDGPDAFDSRAFVAGNRSFHSVLMTAARSERLVRLSAMIVEQSILHTTARQYDKAGLARSHADHEELVLAMIARDSEWARSLMTTHIRRALHVTMRQATP